MKGWAAGLHFIRNGTGSFKVGSPDAGGELAPNELRQFDQAGKMEGAGRSQHSLSAFATASERQPMVKNVLK